LSQITGPTSGVLKLKGRVASLLEVGTGFHPELSGRDNIFLNGAILGMKKFEIKSKFDQIVDFAGVERYIDTPVKRYSSGMYVRLAFAVAAYLESEILIVDEVLAVGDAEFQKKCLGKMSEISGGEGRTVLFVSHNMSSVSELCSKGMYLESGKVIYYSDVDEVINNYMFQNKTDSYFISEAIDDVNKDAYFKEIRVLNNALIDNSIFFVNQPIFISFKIKINRKKEKYSVFCMIVNQKMNRVFAAERESLDDEFVLKINPNFLVRGKYSLQAFIHIPRIKQEDIVENVCQFEIFDNESALVKHGGYDYGSVFGNFTWI
jgi:lipopolysaccharide transport system ATP-binding protein